MAYHRHHGLDVRIVRIFNTFGPHQRADDGRAVSNFLVQALRGDPITIFGDGSQTRSFCYVDDEIRGFLALLDGDITGPVNIGNPAEFTIRQLAEMVLEVTGSNVRARLRAAPRRRPDPAPARSDARPLGARMGTRDPPAHRSRAHGRVLPPDPRRHRLRVRERGPHRVYPHAELESVRRRHPCPAMTEIRSPLQGTVVSIEVAGGDIVRAGQALLLIESMKMHHDIVAPEAGRIDELTTTIGAAVMPGDLLARIEPVASVDGPADTPGTLAPAEPSERPDLAESVARHLVGLDESRPDAVARRRAVGRRTARENIADLVDAGSFIEYGPLVIAAQRRRRELQDLIANTPADGLVGGIGTVNGTLFEGEAARCIAMSYDYTVLAGTQGLQNHRKKDRLFELAERMRLPIVFFTEGGGGRPGDTDGTGPSGLDCLAFLWLAELSGLVPLVGVNAGYCFAGNAAILGCCDVVIATTDSNIGMGGPAMIEGGGLGVFEPTAIGPIDVQRRNGVVDLVADDEAAAVALAKQYLSYFQGRLDRWDCADQAAAA